MCWAPLAMVNYKRYRKWGSQFSLLVACNKYFFLTWYLTPGFWLALRMLIILSAALTGTVDFSTTILLLFAVPAILLAHASMYFKSAARPFRKKEVKFPTAVNLFQRSHIISLTSLVNFSNENPNIYQKSKFSKIFLLTFPSPYVLVGVFTEINMRSASIIAVSISVEKKRFLPRHPFTISSKPGWKYVKVPSYEVPRKSSLNNC